VALLAASLRFVTKAMSDRFLAIPGDFGGEK
jgi:hypothetical protein